MMKFSSFKDLTRIELSLFGLPFIFSGAILALPYSQGFDLKWLWILPAFFTARISGMAFNQYIDRHIDAQNPRTKNRALPSGRVSLKQARLTAWGSLFLFLIVCWQINLLCFLLSPIAAFLLATYSYTKRINAFCHLVLGMIHFFGPLMAGVAISGHFLWSSFFLGLASMFLISGTDIIYAMQDFEFDCQTNLHSIPSRFGLKRSIACSRIFHLCSFAAFFFVGLTGYLPLFYYLSLIVIAIAIYHFHAVLQEHFLQLNGALKEIEKHFFQVNIIVSTAAFFFIFASVSWAVMF